VLRLVSTCLLSVRHLPGLTAIRKKNTVNCDSPQNPNDASPQDLKQQASEEGNCKTKPEETELANSDPPQELGDPLDFSQPFFSNSVLVSGSALTNLIEGPDGSEGTDGSGGTNGLLLSSDAPVQLPEPLTVSLFAMGLAGALLLRRGTINRPS